MSEVTIFLTGMSVGVVFGLIIGALVVMATKNMKKEEKNK